MEGPPAILAFDARLGVVNSEKLEQQKSYIATLEPGDVCAYVDEMYRRMQVDGVVDLTPREFVEVIGQTFGLSFDRHFNQQELDDFITYNIKEVVAVQQAMAAKGLLRDTAELVVPGVADTRVKLNIVMNTIHSVNRFLTLLGRLKFSFDEMEHNTGFDPGTVGRASGERSVTPMTLDGVKLTDHQVVLLHCLNTACELEYRRAADYCYKPVRVPVGDGSGEQLKTHAWVEAVGITEFVYECCPKETDFAMWRCLTSRGSGGVPAAAEYLRKCCDPEFPPLVKDRHVFAFANGTLVCWATEDGSSRFVPYRLAPGERGLPSSVVAANYFEDVSLQDMTTTPWRDIPTPNLDKILETQEFPAEVMRWMYVFIGRLLYNLNEHDSWQVIPFLKGVGGCGKSTLINDVCGILYHKHDVAILSNNCERRFGLSGLVGRNLFLAPEIKEDLALEQAEFQSIVTGEEVQINTKNETARSIRWTMPGMLAGNQMPNWADNSGSIARRVVVFQFNNPVPINKGDSELKAKLRAEIGFLLQKCSLAYREAVAEVGSDNIWSHLPPYFLAQQDQLRMETSSLEHFLVNGGMRFGSDLYMPRQDFQRMYRDYCTNNNMRTQTFKQETFASTFMRYGVRAAKKHEARPYQGSIRSAHWFVGVAPGDEAAGEDEDNDEGF